MSKPTRLRPHHIDAIFPQGATKNTRADEGRAPSFAFPLSFSTISNSVRPSTKGHEASSKQNESFRHACDKSRASASSLQEEEANQPTFLRRSFQGSNQQPKPGKRNGARRASREASNQSGLKKTAGHYRPATSPKKDFFQLGSSTPSDRRHREAGDHLPCAAEAATGVGHGAFQSSAATKQQV